MNIRPLLFAASLALLPVVAFGQGFTGPATITQPTTANHCVKIGPNGGNNVVDAGANCGPASGITALTGDVTASGPGSAAATVNSYNGGTPFGTAAAANTGTGAGNVPTGGVITAGGPVGSATQAPSITYNAAGQITAISPVTITPAIGSITGLGTGIATALGVNTGSAGAPVLFNGAGGTPSSMTGTNITGTASGLTAGNASAAPWSGITGTPTTVAGYGITDAVKVIGQSNLPMVLAGSGSMANNGALTLTNALGTTYANAYVYLPVNAISSGSAAGWYYAVFSSTTAATVYNNTYTSGTPAIPGSPTPFSTTGPGAYTGTNASINLYSLSIPGNFLGANGGIRVSENFSYTNSAANKTLLLAFGGTNFLSSTQTATVAAAYIAGFKNRGVTNAQVSIAGAGTTTFSGTGTAVVYGSVDTTTSQTLSVTVSSATPASNNVVLETVTVEYLPGVP